MKFLVTLLAITLFTSAPPAWNTDFKSAKEEASKSGKYILVNFSGSDWCGPCIRMHKELFDSEEFSSYATNNLLLVNADFPRLKKHQLSKDQEKKNEALAEKYNKQGHFPFTVLVDKEGKAVKTWDGLPNEDPSQYVKEIEAIIHGGK